LKKAPLYLAVTLAVAGWIVPPVVAYAAPDRLAEAVTLQKARNWSGAEKALRKAVEEEPGAASNVALGRFLILVGRPAEALPLFRKALEADAALPDALAGEAEALGDLGKYSQAMANCEKAIDRFDGDKKVSRKQLARFYLILAGAQGQAAQKEGILAMIKYAFSVKKNIDKALDLDPAYARAVYGSGVYYLEAPSVVGGDAGKGLALLEKAHKLDPDDYGIHSAWIGALADGGRKDDARREADRYRQAFSGVPAAGREAEVWAAKIK